MPAHEREVEPEAAEVERRPADDLTGRPLRIAVLIADPQLEAGPALEDEARREALKIAAGFRGEEAFNAGVGEEQAIDTVLPWLSKARCEELLAECLELYVWDRMGSEN